MNYNNLFQKYQKLVGEWGGVPYNVYRPDYSAVDNTPILVHSNVLFRVDPTGPRFSEPRFSSVEYYDIFGNRDLILPGDILLKAIPDGMTPGVTISHFQDIKACIGFRSERIGRIEEESSGLVLHTNVRFDFIGQSFAGSRMNKQIEDSLKIPNTHVVMYKRENLIRQRTHLIETDYSVTVVRADGSTAPYENRWTIDLIEFKGNEMILTVMND